MSKLFLFAPLLVLLASLPSGAQTYYDLPNDNTNCPANCREIPWLAGADTNPAWNPSGLPGGGTLPVYPVGQTCTGLTEGNGTTDNTSAIMTCLNNTTTGHAALIPPGIYYVNGAITIPSNKVLRGSGIDNCTQGRWLSSTFPGDTGAGAACTTLKLGNSGLLRFAASSQRPTQGSDISVPNGTQKGATTIAVASTSGLSVGNWISVYEGTTSNGTTSGTQVEDTSIPVTWAGYGGNCTWCGEGEDNQPGRLMSQFERITAIDTANKILTVSRPLYYTFKAALSAGIRTYAFANTQAGLENIKVNGYGNSRTAPIMDISNSYWSWVKNCELYHDADTAKAFPVYGAYIYGDEVRDSYIHAQRATSADRAYGVGFMFVTSDNKVENNTIREQRHGTAQEGGGSGNVYLYNYIDDLYYLYDYTWMEAIRTNHGAHPYFTFYEGNIAPKFGPDGEWGSSSHGVAFRNWFWGDDTMNYSGTGVPATNPNYGFDAIAIDHDNTYYSLVGNVLGNPNLHTNWANAAMSATSSCNEGTRSTPIVYRVGCDDGNNYNANSWNTMIRHGNFDYKTNGVAEWGGGTNHTLKPSMYYTSKPAFFGSCAWPPFGPEGNPTIGTLPAEARYEGNTTCSGGGTIPTPPTGLTVVVQ